jgi:hypothetical protein
MFECEDEAFLAYESREKELIFLEFEPLNFTLPSVEIEFVEKLKVEIKYEPVIVGRNFKLKEDIDLI